MSVCQQNTPPPGGAFWQVRTEGETRSPRVGICCRGCKVPGRCCWIQSQCARLGSTEEPASGDVMEGWKQEVLVGSGFQLGRRAGPSTGRRCVSVCEIRRSSCKRAHLFHNSAPILVPVFFDVKCDTVNYGCVSGEAASSSFQ